MEILPHEKINNDYSTMNKVLGTAFGKMIRDYHYTF